MKLRIFSDPHIGVNRQANTSTASRKKIMQRAYDTTMACLSRPDEQGICGGDLFDKYRVDPGSMLQAMQVLDRCFLCLSGNHDTINDKDAMGSLQFLSHVAQTQVCAAPYGKAHFETFLVSSTRVYAIPHVTTQALFEQALEEVYEEAQKDKSLYKLLFLHCNFDYPEERLSGAELNLTRDDAEALIEDCGLTVLIGHMHTPADHYDGKLRIIGSTTNTGFADLSDKRTLLYDTDTGEFQSETHWRLKDHALTLDVHSLTPEALDQIPAQTEFLTLTGEVEPDGIFALSTLHKHCWDELPNLLALRDTTTLVTGEPVTVGTDDIRTTQTFGQFLQARIPDEDMKALFKEVQDYVA